MRTSPRRRVTSNERANPVDPPQFLHGKRYRPLSQHYRERFGTKVFKVSVSAAETCPNREGLGGMRVCVFCDEWGSAAYHQHRDLPTCKRVVHRQPHQPNQQRVIGRQDQAE